MKRAVTTSPWRCSTDGYLSVNGEFVDAFEIPSEPAAGDLWLASGTFPENAQEGVETPYSDWTIWSLERG